HGRVLPRTDDEPRGELLAAEDQIRVVHAIPHRTMSPLASRLDAAQLAPPPIGRTISTLSPSWRRVAAQALVGVTSPFAPTAVCSPGPPRGARDPPRRKR